MHDPPVPSTGPLSLPDKEDEEAAAQPAPETAGTLPLESMEQGGIQETAAPASNDLDDDFFIESDEDGSDQGPVEPLTTSTPFASLPYSGGLPPRSSTTSSFGMSRSVSTPAIPTLLASTSACGSTVPGSFFPSSCAPASSGFAEQHFSARDGGNKNNSNNIPRSVSCPKLTLACIDDVLEILEGLEQEEEEDDDEQSLEEGTTKDRNKKDDHQG